jgi:hypothetical protein
MPRRAGARPSRPSVHPLAALADRLLDHPGAGEDVSAPGSEFPWTSCPSARSRRARAMRGVLQRRGVLAPALDKCGVDFQVMHGFSSATAACDLALDDDGRELVVI